MRNSYLMISAILTIGFCPIVQSDTPQNLHPTTTVDYVPLDNGTPRVSVRLSETVTANLILDTGASRCFLSDTVKNKLNLPTHPADDGSGNPLIVDSKIWQEVITPYLRLGLIDSPNCPFIVLPTNGIEKLSSGKTDGLIGTNFFILFATLIDPIKKQVTFWPTQLNEDDLKSVGFENAVILPLVLRELGGDGLIRVRVRFDETEQEISLDTGAAKTTLPAALVRKLKLKDTQKGLPQHTPFGTVTINEAHLPSLTLGKLTVNDLEIQYTQGKETRGFFPHIGMDVLSRFRFILDAPGKKLYLIPITAPAKSDATHEH